MSAWLQAACVLVLVGAPHVPLGDQLAPVYTTDRHWRVERLLYRCCGVDPRSEQRWTHHLRALLAFSAVSVLGLYAILIRGLVRHRTDQLGNFWVDLTRGLERT